MVIPGQEIQKPTKLYWGWEVKIWLYFNLLLVNFFMWNKAVVVVVDDDDDKNDLQQDVTDGFNHVFTILTFVPVSEVTNSNSRWLYLPLVLILIYRWKPVKIAKPSMKRQWVNLTNFEYATQFLKKRLF